MLASLLLNLGTAGNAIFTIGARLTFRPHAPEVTTEYEADQWASPQGRAPNRSLEIILNLPATATVTRIRPQTAKPRQVTVEAEWHVDAEFVSGAKAAIRHWSFDVDAGQTIEFDVGPRTVITANPGQAIGSWTADARVMPTRTLLARRAKVTASAGATAIFSEADFNQFFCNPPDVTGICNPSPAEIIAIIQAARKSKIVRQFDNKKI